MNKPMFSKDGLITANPSAHSPHQIIPRLILPNTTVLDVGCNTGMLGLKLHRHNTLDGIDINPQALKIAKPYYRHLYQIDLSSSENLKISNRYDYIVFSDILEHLPRPDLLLIRVKKLLKPNGIIICSLPNIGRFEIRLGLLFGHFDYTQAGIINQDHLRFFTRDSAQQLFTQTGYQVTKIIPTGLGHRLKIFPTLTAFQFIYLAKLK
jgi:O-antigen biosynthesis protein